eukprot:9225076-Pyramimonas_sp.AAC.1
MAMLIHGGAGNLALATPSSGRANHREPRATLSYNWVVHESITPPTLPKPAPPLSTSPLARLRTTSNFGGNSN